MSRNQFIILFAGFSLFRQLAFSQSTEIKPGTILPQVTTAQRNAITSPNGILVFDSSTQSYWYRQSGSWVELPKGGSTSNYWQLNGTGGNIIQNTNSGGFWSSNASLVTEANNTTYPPTAPVQGAGTRLMWIPSRSAFRVGTVFNDYWNADSIGIYSFASGYNSRATSQGTFASGGYSYASGDFSTALGFASTSKGIYATAIGPYSSALGWFSVAMGRNAETTGQNSIAIGHFANASNTNCVSLGYNAIASGLESMALGRNVTASGYSSIVLGSSSTSSSIYSVAIGSNVTASGEKSVAMGNEVSSNGHTGAFTVGDADPLNEGITYSGAANQFVARFYNGYFLLTSGNGSAANPRTGVSISHGQTAWSATSDSTKKEKFVKANGEDFLVKLKKLRLGSWNYISDDKKPERFYGPMAQEIFAAYGKDSVGKIGSDTLVSTLNMDGILFIYAQALEKRTADLKLENDSLRETLLRISKRLDMIEEKEEASLR